MFDKEEPGTNVLVIDRIGGGGHSAQLPIEVKRCPAPSHMFTGRESQVAQVKTCLLSGADERRVCVVHGIGGAGKTQIALQAIEMTKGSWSDIIYVDATSQDATVNSLKEFAIANQIGETHKDVIRWLESNPQPWLLVFDNADDPDLGLASFFPQGSRGSILVTTRLPELALLAHGPDSTCDVGGMDPEDALELLLKQARLQDRPALDGEVEAAAELVKDFGYLALAVVHAGAYIWCSGSSVAKYRKHSLELSHIFLDKYNDMPVKIEHFNVTLYTIWSIIYERLKPRTQKMLWLLAFMHHDGINEDIFRRAAIHSQTYQPEIPPDSDEADVLTEVKKYLGFFLDDQKGWRSDAFSGVMGELLSYSLVDYDRINETYAIHVLVQGWARTVIPYPNETALAYTSLVLALSIDWSTTTEDYAFRRTLGPHIVNQLHLQAQINTSNATRFALVLGELGQWSHQKTLWAQVLDTRKRILGEEHPDTLTAMDSLASTYLSQGRWEEAEVLQVRVADVRKRVLGEEHPQTLASMGSLILTYRSRYRWREAEVLEVQLLDLKERVLGKEHPSTLATMGSLTLTYWSQGKWEKAEVLGVQVVDAKKRVLGEEHPRTLASVGTLASIYQSQGRLEEAAVLMAQATDATKRVLGEEHSDTIGRMSTLASIYYDQGRWDQAETLQACVVDGTKRMLGEEHPHTLNSMAQLASTYSRQGRWDQAEALGTQALTAMKRVLGEQHPDTLTAKRNLAIYNSQARLRRKEYEEIKAHIRRLENMTR